MKCKLYQTPQDFLEDNRGFLLKYEAARAAEPWEMRSPHSGEACHPGLLSAATKNREEPLLLFGNTLPWNLCRTLSPERHTPQPLRQSWRSI